MAFALKGLVPHWERNIKNNLKTECKVTVVSGTKKKKQKNISGNIHMSRRKCTPIDATV